MKGIYLTTPAPSHVTSALVNIARPGPVSASPLNMDRLTRSTHQAGPIKLAYLRGATTHPARHHRRRWWSSGPPSNPNGTGTRRRLRSSGSGCRARGHGGPAFVLRARARSESPKATTRRGNQQFCHGKHAGAGHGGGRATRGPGRRRRRPAGRHLTGAAQWLRHTYPGPS